MRHVATIVTALVTVLSATVVIGSGPASAQDFDVRLRASGHKVSSGACRDIHFTVSHTAGYLDRFTAAVEVWRGSKYVGDTFDYIYDSSGPLNASYYWCPYEGVGTYRLGPTRVEWDDFDADQGGAFTDDSQVRVRVLQAARFVDLRLTRRGNVRTMSGRLRYFDTGVSTWRSAPKGIRIRLQRRTRSGWDVVNAGRTGSKGFVSISARSTKKLDHRLLSPRTARTWNARSRALRK